MAGRIALDLKQFKHVKSDAKSTTLQHQDGHTITLHHPALGKDTQEALKAMANSAMTHNQAEESQDQAPRGMGQKADKQFFADGGMPQALDPNYQPPSAEEEINSAIDQAPKGGDLAAKRAIYNNVASLDADVGDPAAQQTSPQPQNQFGPNGQAPQNFDARAWSEAEAKYKAAKDTAEAHKAQVSANVAGDNAARISAGLAPRMMPDGSDGGQPQADMGGQQPMGDASMAPQQPQQAPAPGSDDPYAGAQNMLDKGLNNAISGLNQGAAAQGALGKQQAAQLDQNLQQQQTAQTNFQNSYNELDQERKAHISDIQNGYIDPQKYWNDHSKVASGIGMILAGFNPTSNPNAAVNFLKFQMEQNLQAQSKNLESKNNLLNANLKQFGNMKDATEMTRIMQHDILSNQLQSAAGKAASPIAKAAALAAAGKLQMDVAPQFKAFAMTRAMMQAANAGNGNSDPAVIGHMIAQMKAMGQPELAKDMESRFVPGVGMSPTTPIPQEIRTEISGKQQFDQLAKRYQEFAKQHSGSLSPAMMNQGRAMALELQNAYRNATHGGVYKEGEQHMIESIIPSDPTQFFNSMRTNPKLQELIQTNANNSNNLRKNYGLPLIPPSASAHEQAIKWAQANPKDPRAAQILKAQGR